MPHWPPDQPDLSLHRLVTEQSNAASVEIDRMTPLQIVQLMNAEDAKVADGRCERVAVDCGGG